jgi:hypothetical protein
LVLAKTLTAICIPFGWALSWLETRRMVWQLSGRNQPHSAMRRHLHHLITLRTFATNSLNIVDPTRSARNNRRRQASTSQVSHRIGVHYGQEKSGEKDSKKGYGKETVRWQGEEEVT